jgi:hypothetical protein
MTAIIGSAEVVKFWTPARAHADLTIARAQMAETWALLDVASAHPIATVPRPHPAGTSRQGGASLNLFGHRFSCSGKGTAEWQRLNA